MIIDIKKNNKKLNCKFSFEQENNQTSNHPSFRAKTPSKITVNCCNWMTVKKPDVKLKLV